MATRNWKTTINDTPVDEGLIDLRNAIIRKAVMDYKAVVKRNKGNDVYAVKEIETFFQSELCSTLLSDTNITGQDILNKLHMWKYKYLRELKRETTRRGGNDGRKEKA